MKEKLSEKLDRFVHGSNNFSMNNSTNQQNLEFNFQKIETNLYVLDKNSKEAIKLQQKLIIDSLRELLAQNYVMYETIRKLKEERPQSPLSA
ncbi:hypothetical protein AAG747_14145 [Rapidithrix thailandica]|uniref:Uncharacterized protein n=1 Tax=Rapidithrix thailandica TaxID=413964 RepID=A0AAW9S7S2_9BACT